MPAGDELGDQLLRDGALLDELGQQPLAEERHEPLAVPLDSSRQEPFVRPASVVIRWRWRCHPGGAAVAIETTTPGQASRPQVSQTSPAQAPDARTQDDLSQAKTEGKAMASSSRPLSGVFQLRLVAEW